MNKLLDSIIYEDYDKIKNKLCDINHKIDRIAKKQTREYSFFGILFIAIVTLTTNLWAQYVYNNLVTNFGRGTQYNSDSLIMLFVFIVLAIGVAILFVIDREDPLI